jgi:hypothetical protein
MYIKATTQHGTFYLIDDEANRAVRVKAENRNDMYGDSEWFDFKYFCSYDRDTIAYGDNGSLDIGKSIYFEVENHPQYDWRITTDVVSLEIVRDDE